MEKMKVQYKSLEVLDLVALVVLFIGGVNWGLLGIFNWNLVHAIFGPVMLLERLIYILVGVSAIYMAVVTPAVLRHHYHEPSSTTTAHPL